jgi:hypothetical protein
MALCRTITCSRCNERKEVWFSASDFGPPDICGGCSKKDRDASKRADLDALAALSMEERVARIEEWIYEHRRNHPQREVMF